MRRTSLTMVLASLLPAVAFAGAQDRGAALPAAPLPSLSLFAQGQPPLSPGLAGVSTAGASAFGDPLPSADPAQRDAFSPPATSSPPGANASPLTREQAEQLALRNNPRITADRLLALAAGQITREVRAGELPQIGSNITAMKAEDASRLSSGGLTSSRLYSHVGAGGTFSQLLTDFGHTQNLVANARLLAKAQQQTALATEQDVLFATDQAFYRLLNAQSLLEVAQATVQARGSVQQLTGALTKSALKSDLDLNVASADLSQAQLLQLDAENAVASAEATLAALLAMPPESSFRAVEETASLSPPPDDANAMIHAAQTQRPDLQAVRDSALAYGKLAHAQQLQHLPTITALAVGGSTPVRPGGAVYVPDWYAGAGVNLSLPLFTGFRIDAQVKEAELRERSTEKQAAALSDNIARDVRVATLAAQTAFQRIGVAETYRKETERALSLAQTRYKLGLTSIVELSQAQLQSTQATVTAVDARYDYLLALRSLDYTQGRLVP